ncbi:MAG: DUF5615 family PIN-like protein [Ginsengibacter sp.]
MDYIGLNIPPTDTEMWNYALVKNLIIVTNDEYFLDFANIKGFPPKVILLKTGNQSNSYFEALLIKHRDNIQSMHQSDDYGILELF